MLLELPTDYKLPALGLDETLARYPVGPPVFNGGWPLGKKKIRFGGNTGILAWFTKLLGNPPLKCHETFGACSMTPS